MAEVKSHRSGEGPQGVRECLRSYNGWLEIEPSHIGTTVTFHIRKCGGNSEKASVRFTGIDPIKICLCRAWFARDARKTQIHFTFRINKYSSSFKLTFLILNQAFQSALVFQRKRGSLYDHQVFLPENR